MTPEQAAALQKPFPAESIGKKPVVTCKVCSANKERHHCDKHKAAKCKICDNYLTSSHDHLDFVGHAYVRERLLEVDPEWNWKPLAVDDHGRPMFDNDGGMWINLTICGVTRLGYGDADGKRGGRATKEVIGDALRNAGQSFGIALEQWKKGAKIEASTPVESNAIANEQPTLTKAELLKQLRGQCLAIYRARAKDTADCAADYLAWSIGPDDPAGRDILTESDPSRLVAFKKDLQNQAVKP